MVQLEVSCVRRNHAGSIIGIGGVHAGSRWYYSENDAVQYILNYRAQFFVNVNGHWVEIDAVPINGTYHLKTKPDGKFDNNLKSLRECP